MQSTALHFLALLKGRVPFQVMCQTGKSFKILYITFHYHTIILLITDSLTQCLFYSIEDKKEIYTVKRETYQFK